MSPPQFRAFVSRPGRRFTINFRNVENRVTRQLCYNNFVWSYGVVMLKQLRYLLLVAAAGIVVSCTQNATRLGSSMSTPPPPLVAPTYLVFFDFDKSILSDDAQKIIEEAADYARQNGTAALTAIGHADTAGASAYNMDLSKRRADAVKAALIARGIAAQKITVRSLGEAQALPPAGAAPREPQYRRVEIILE